MSSGKVICVCGATGEGKTTFIKNKFKSNRQTFLYLRVESDFEGSKVMKFTNFSQFIKEVNTKKNKLMIIDEAFTCLPKTLNIKMDKPDFIHNQFADVLVNARKMNNFLIIILHSCSQVPAWLVPYLDWFIRFNTNDQFEYQAQRFRSFPIIENSLKKKPTLPKYKPEILKLR